MQTLCGPKHANFVWIEKQILSLQKHTNNAWNKTYKYCLDQNIQILSGPKHTNIVMQILSVTKPCVDHTNFVWTEQILSGPKHTKNVMWILLGTKPCVEHANFVWTEQILSGPKHTNIVWNITLSGPCKFCLDRTNNVWTKTYK